MKAVLQRVISSKVTVDEQIVSQIGKGLNILLGVSADDTLDDVGYLAEKIVNLRIFEDSDGKMNLSLLDIGGDALIISQFTLLADCRKGRRPNFIEAARPEKAVELYEAFAERIKMYGVKNVKTGLFGADMTVEIINDGPVTIMLDTKKN